MLASDQPGAAVPAMLRAAVAALALALSALAALPCVCDGVADAPTPPTYPPTFSVEVLDIILSEDVSTTQHIWVDASGVGASRVTTASERGTDTTLVRNDLKRL